MLLPLWSFAALTAAIASLFGMFLGRDKPLSWRAWKPIGAVLVFDVAAGIAALSVVSLIHRHMTSTPAIWPAVVAGIGGPALLRARTPKLLSNKIGDWRLFGALRALQIKAERDIDRICTAAETSRLDGIMAKLAGLSVGLAADWVSRYLSRADREDGADQGRRLQHKIRQVQDTLTDYATAEDIRKKTIVQILLDSEGYGAVRSLVQYAKSLEPKRLVSRRLAFRRRRVKALMNSLNLPSGFRVEALEGRVRIGYPDRHVDDELRGVAYRLKNALGKRAAVEGVYEGWIVLRPRLTRAERKACGAMISWLVTQLRACSACNDSVFQRDGVVLDPLTGLYASAALVISPRNVAVSPDALCGGAFSGSSVKLVGEVAIADSGDDDSCTYKRHMYAIARVLIYVILDASRRRITVYSSPTDGEYANSLSIPFGDPIQLPSPFLVSLDTKELLA